MRSRYRQSPRDEEEIFKALEEGGIDAASEKANELFTKWISNESEIKSDEREREGTTCVFGEDCRNNGDGTRMGASFLAWSTTWRVVDCISCKKAA